MVQYLLVLPVEAGSDEYAWSLMTEVEDHLRGNGIQVDTGGGSVYYAENATIDAEGVPAG